MKNVPIKTAAGMRWIEAGRIAYVRASGNYSIVHLTDKSKITSTAPLKHYESLLSEESFYRIHHACVLNTDMQMEIKGKGNAWVVILPCMTVLEVSARKKKKFLEFMDGKTAE